MSTVETGIRYSAPPEFGKRCRLFLDDFLRPDCVHMETGRAIDHVTGQTMLMVGCDGRPHFFSLAEAHLLIRTLKVMKPKDDPVEGRAVKQLIIRLKKAVHKMERR
jgi:hypothetical protein